MGCNPRLRLPASNHKKWGKKKRLQYQTINSVAKPTATRDLTELTDTYNILKNTGFGAGSIYELII